MAAEPSPTTLGTHASGFPSAPITSLHISSSPTRASRLQEPKAIGDVLPELKMARENAILGSYEEALKRYKSAL